MKKLLMAAAACALVIGLAAVPAGAVKSTKQVGGTVSVFVTPNPVPASATTVTATGNVAANSGCRKDRTVHFTYVNSISGASTPLAQTAVTGSNGDYTAVLPRSTATLPSTAVLQATVDQQIRKVGSKKKGKKNKKGRQFNCLQLFGQSGPITLDAPPPAP
jgi:hypothetical protein